MFRNIPRFLVALLLVLLAGRLFAQPAALPPEGALVREVRVEGLNRLAPVEILQVMELRDGTSFSAEAYRRDLQSIANTGKVNPLDLKIDWETSPDGPVILTVHVTENPVVQSIQIVGNSRFTQKEILAQLDYKVGDIMPTAVRASTARNLASFYRQGGFKAANITVSSDPVKDNPDAVNVYITIDEGTRVKIKKVIFIGNTHFSDFLLASRLTNGPGILFFSNYFDPNALEDDLVVVKGAYVDAGYLDARVSKGDLIYDEANKKVTITIVIDAGPRYTVSGVGSEGVAYFTKGEVNKLSVSLPGRYYKGQRTAKAIDKLRRLYGDQGYIDTEVGFRLDKDPAARTAKLVFEVTERPVVFVGQIRLKQEDYDYDVDVKPLNKLIGWFTPPTKPETIYKEVRLKPGEKYRTSDEVRTVERLRNLGIFRKVEVNRVPTETREVRDAVINVEEDPNAAFVGASAGIGETAGPSVTFQLVQPNYGGRADRFNASATFGTRSVGFRIGYFDRYLGESKNSLDTNLYYLTDRYRAYRQRTIGASTELGRPISDRLTGYARLRAEYVSFSSFSDEADEDFDSYPVLAVRPMLVYDERDNKGFPTRGFLVGGGLETGFADGFLLKFLHNYEWYKQPFERSEFVYAYEHTVGLMPFDARNVGIGERFFVGGSGSLRGFQYREVGPRDDGDKDLAIGGATRITQRHELRYPFNDFIKGRIFTDLAILERGAFQLGTPRMGSGVGAIMDFGPLIAEVDLAVPVLRESRDRPQYFHIRLGSDF